MGRLVYSTHHGAICPDCRKPISQCTCRQRLEAPTTDGIVRVRRETKGRKGKGVTVITGIPLAPAELVKLGTQLKKQCGTGGTVKAGNVELQGDHREMVIEELKKLGFTVKRAGG